MILSLCRRMVLLSGDALEVTGKVSRYSQLVFKQFTRKSAYGCTYVYVETHIYIIHTGREERLDNCGRKLSMSLRWKINGCVLGLQLFCRFKTFQDKAVREKKKNWLNLEFGKTELTLLLSKDLSCLAVQSWQVLVKFNWFTVLVF